jgi:hypothetical protein
LDRLALSLVAAPFVFAVCALATRAPVRRIGAALAGGAAFGIGNAAWDFAARSMGWWSYPTAGPGIGPPIWYAAAGLSAAGVSLIGWRVVRRFGRRGCLAFLLGFALYCVLRDALVAAAADAVIRFGPGPAPYLADAAAAFTLMAVALAVQDVLGGDRGRLR